MSALRNENAKIRKDLEVIKEELSNLETQQVAERRRPSGPGSVDFDSSQALGDAGAKVAIIEYTDYQCPFCARHAEKVLPSIRENLIEPGHVRYQVADYPLSFHAKAEQAAVAANCAGEQGQYWAMHDALFENQNKLGEELYQQTAKQLELNIDAFTECLNDPASAKAVNRSIAYGNSVGVSGTPKFFIGRIEGDSITDVSSISGAQSYGVFAATVEKLLNGPG